MKYFIIIFFITACTSVISAQDTLSLNDYRAKVIAYNQDIKIAQQTVAAARAFAKEVRTGFLPAVSASGEYSYNFNPQTFTLGAMQEDLQPARWSAGGEITQPLFTGGLLSATHHIAQIEQDIAALTEELQTDNITYLSEVTYWQTVAGGDYMKTFARYIDILKNLYAIVETRFNDGLISKTDLLKMEVSLREASYEESKVKQIYVNKRILLNILMGAPVENEHLLSDTLSKSAMIQDFLSYEDVLNQRPDYLIKGKEIDLQKQQKKLDRSEFLPKAQIGASADYGTPFINFSGDPLWSPIVYAKLSIPIFEWGKSRHSKHKNDALILSKQLAQSSVADDIRKKLDIAINNMTESANQNDIALATLKTAQESLELHTFSYREGQVSILDVQFAQIAWLQANAKVIESYLNYQVALSEYKREVSGK